MTNRVVATVRTSEREEVRVTFEDYRGTRMVGVRHWFQAKDGTTRPSNHGLKIRLKLLPELASALAKAAREAKAERLLAASPAYSGTAKARVAPRSHEGATARSATEIQAPCPCRRGARSAGPPAVGKPDLVACRSSTRQPRH